jgi:drug/metabolite transporter (DMT)-like permease
MHFYGGVGGTLALGLLMLAGSAMGIDELKLTLPTRPDTWAIFLGTGIVGLVGHLLFAQAFRLAPASTLAPFAYGEIVSAVMLGYLVFGSFPDAFKWVGIAIIVGSGAYIFHRERFVARRTALGIAEH